LTSRPFRVRFVRWGSRRVDGRYEGAAAALHAGEQSVMARPLWLTLGLLSTACGIAGVVLPLVPTTPFLLLAAYAFARSSPRLHDWLVKHPRLGPPINDWRAHGAISRRAKIASVAVMAAMVALSIVAGVNSSVIMVQAVVLCAVATFILTRPDGPRSG
jgi:uncharacterized membrane protein YbaN (DUF454 family)